MLATYVIDESTFSTQISLHHQVTTNVKEPVGLSYTGATTTLPTQWGLIVGAVLPQSVIRKVKSSPFWPWSPLQAGIK